MQVSVFHPGTQHSWQTALALQQLGKLETYHTSIFYQPTRMPYRLEGLLPTPIGRRLASEFRRFSHPGLDPTLVQTSGLAEWAERIAARAGFRELAQMIDRFGNRRFASHMRKSIQSARPFALWGYNGSSLGSFKLARACDRTCILDRTIGDFRIYNAMMDEVAESYGDWFLPSEGEISRTDIESDEREYYLADKILVGSPFAAETIRNAVSDPAITAKLRVLPYCYDEKLFAGLPSPQQLSREEPVRFLFVGQVNPRKGIHHLLEAIARIPPTEAHLTIVGDLKVPTRVFDRYTDRVTYVPNVARGDVPGIMAEHHVLVLPSYFEGSSLTLLEALAAGMAIIQTRAAGLGGTGETGILLERPDTDLVHTALLAAIEDRERLDRWRTTAQIVAQTYTFGAYRGNISILLDEIFPSG